MIDALDKQTQALPFEQVKRGRGRPKTGNAMTPAEKQRAYRERQKAATGNVTEKSSDYVQILETARDTMHDRIEFLQRRIDDLVGENRALKKELSKRHTVTKKVQTIRRYVLQWQHPEKGTWHDDKTGDFGSKARADAACKAMNKEGFSETLWRVRERQWV